MFPESLINDPVLLVQAARNLLWLTAAASAVYFALISVLAATGILPKVTSIYTRHRRASPKHGKFNVGSMIFCATTRCDLTPMWDQSLFDQK